MYFSQFGEDKRLHKIFGSHCGTCVEVGAHDGTHFSNTRFFELQGWNCVLVEPNPNLWPLIEKSRPKSQLFKCAASATRGKLVLHIQTPEGGEVEIIDLATGKLTGDVKESGR